MATFADLRDRANENLPSRFKKKMGDIVKSHEVSSCRSRANGRPPAGAWLEGRLSLKISAVGLPWYRKEHYFQLRALFVGGARLHETYAGWLTLRGQRNLIS